jgi:serine protease Do
MYGMKRLFVLAFLGVCAALGGLLGSVLFSSWPTPLRAQGLSGAPAAPRLGPPSSEVLALSDRFEEVARRVAPAVVSLDASHPSRSSAGRGRLVEESGSGVLVQLPPRPGYFVLTNNHVVSAARPDQITIYLGDGRIFQPRQVWADPETDVALLGLGEVAGGLPTVPLGDSDQVRVGQWVLAVGSPFGLSQTVTHGIISARDRGQVSLGNTIRIKDFLQTDAAINPGSSGGPLVNLRGEVIGLNTAIASHSGTNSGVSFSIPVNLVKQVVQQLLERGQVARGYLGMQLAPALEPADALRLGLNRLQGALVEQVYPDTPAAQAGLKPGDVILQVENIVIRNDNHLINLISALPAGQRIRLLVWRDRRQVTLEAVVGDWNKAQERFRLPPPP